MSILSIRANAKALILDPLVGATDGLGEALAYPPDSVGVLPLAWFGPATAEVKPADNEIWDWSLPLNVAIAGLPLYGVNLAHAEAVLANVLAQWRSHYTLGHTTSGLELKQATEGLFDIGGQTWVGLTLRFRIKENVIARKEG